jgi:CubicO group peptidase (beta-lactamase class C family)
MIKRLISIIIIVLVTVVSVESVNAKEPLKANVIQNIMDSAIDKEGPGMAVIAIHKGKTVFHGARGMANIELNVPLSANTVFRLGSITKQFTCAAVLMLEEQGKLSIDDPLSRYLPSFPTDGAQVTLRQLMSHTAGLNNYTNNHETMEKRIQVPVSIEEMLKLFSKEPMLFSPGEQMQYSNTGYVLLGKIIEDVSGVSYKEFIENEIFKPLGMSSSFYGGRQIVKNRAMGYSLDETGVVNASVIDMSWPHAAGALISNVKDLAVWNEALRSGKVVSLKNYHTMTEPTTLNDGTKVPYGFGLSPSKINKYKSIGHGGGIPGFSTDAVYFPSEDLFIAVFANSDRLDPDSLTLKVAAEILNISFPSFKPVAIPNKQFKALLGQYQVNSNSIRELLFEDEHFYTQRDGGRKLEVVPVSKSTFHYPGTLDYLVFEKNSSDQIEMKLYGRLAEKPQVALKIQR